MIIYEVHISIDEEVEEEWLNWMKTVHVPHVIATGLVQSYQILTTFFESSHLYLFQYYFDALEDYEQYQQKFSPSLREEVLEKYEGKFRSKRAIYKRV